MSSADPTQSGAPDWPFANPRRLLQVGLGAAGVGFALYSLPLLVWRFTGLDFGTYWLDGSFWTVLRVLLIAVGSLSAAGAVVAKPRSAGVVALAAVAALLGCLAMDPDWDSARLVMALLFWIGMFATFLLLLPWLMARLYVAYEYLAHGDGSPNFDRAEERGRFAGWVLSRVIISLLVVLHFVAIASAVMSVPVGGRNQSWLFQQTWTTLQPYIQFTYLNNAYRFYSPEPGPPSLLWIRVEYSDGAARWLLLPVNRVVSEEEMFADADSDAWKAVSARGPESQSVLDPLSQEFTRRLSIGESVNQQSPINFRFDELKQRRIAVANKSQIPLHPEVPPEMQFGIPGEGPVRLLRQYAQHVARELERPDATVTGVKIYRVTHRLLEPWEMAQEGERHQEPNAPWTYRVYYQGEYTKDGEMKNPTDPFLFWMIPIYRWPTGRGVPFQADPNSTLYLERGEYQVHNFVKKHAQLKGEE